MKDLEIISDFTIFLQNKGLTIQDICQYLVTVSLKDYGFYCAVFAEIQKNGQVRVTSHFGADPKDVEAWQDMDFEIKTPVNDCLRANGEKEWGTKTESDYSGRDLEVYQIFSRMNKAAQHKINPIPVCDIPEEWRD